MAAIVIQLIFKYNYRLAILPFRVTRRIWAMHRIPTRFRLMLSYGIGGATVA